MEPGDIVYYESARCLHGRMNPLRGEYYINLFSHYRPIDDPAWHLKPNPSDGVKQLIDIGECTNVDSQVHCSKVPDNKIPYLSPGLETVSQSGDLFKYWLQTGYTPEEQRNIDAAIALAEENVARTSKATFSRRGSSTAEL